MTHPNVTGLSAIQIAALYAAGLTDPETVAEQTLAAIRACDDPAVFTVLTPERARAEARAARSRHVAGRPRGLLDGVPVAWKDLFDVAGLVTTAGSRVLDDEQPAARDAPVVTRLSDAGMVCVGRVNMTEFAYSGLGLNPHFGTPRNPHGRDEPRAPGGSSSGSAVAVARGLVPIAIGSDTGGSVRVPAGFNGIIGYKSSFGRYPSEGAFPLSPSLDTVGVLCRSVPDAVLADAALLGRVCTEVTARRAEGRRIIVPTNIVLDDLEPAVARNFASALDRLAASGAVVERRSVEALDDVVSLMARYRPLAAAEAFALHRARIEGPAAERMDRRVVQRMRLGADTTLSDYIAFRHRRDPLIARFTESLGDALLAWPTTAHVAPPIAALEADDALFADVNLRTLRNTILGNVLDLCGLSIPNGTDATGLPTGFLLSAGSGADEDLLGVGLLAESLIRGEV